MSGTDYIVEPRSSAMIAAQIAELKSRTPVDHNGRVRVTDFIKSLVEDGFNGRKLKLKLFTAPENAPQSELAFVNNILFELCCDQELWNDAEIGEPLARFILAHEIGHIILHTNKRSTRYYSPISASDRKAKKEHYSEWQANEFALQFLIPSNALCANVTTYDIARRFGVETDIADRAIHSIKERFIYNGDYCPKCGNQTIAVNSNIVICDECGYQP